MIYSSGELPSPRVPSPEPPSIYPSGPITLSIIEGFLCRSGVNLDTRRKTIGLIAGKSDDCKKDMLALFEQTPAGIHQEIASLSDLFSQDPVALIPHLQYTEQVSASPMKIRRNSPKNSNLVDLIAKNYFPEMSSDAELSVGIQKECNELSGNSYTFTPEPANAISMGNKNFRERFLQADIKAQLETVIPNAAPYNQNFCKYFNGLQNDKTADFCRERLREIVKLTPATVINLDALSQNLLRNDLAPEKELSLHMADINKVLQRSTLDDASKKAVISGITERPSLPFVKGISSFCDAIDDNNILSKVFLLHDSLFRYGRDLSKLQEHFRNTTEVKGTDGKATPYNHDVCDRLLEVKKDQDDEYV